MRVEGEGRCVGSGGVERGRGYGSEGMVVGAAGDTVGKIGA